MNLQDAKVQHLYSKIKYVFKDPTPLNTVITRIGSITDGDTSFERLELLGDAVLNMIVSDMLFGYFPKESSGVLSIFKANLVCSNTLVNVSEVVGLPMFLGDYAIKIKTNNILENAIEALIGAIYIDGGFDHVKSFIVREWENRVKNSSSRDERSHKTTLQIWTQKNKKPLPKYYLVKNYGQEHDLRFKIGVIVQGVGKSYAVGSTIKEAESNAASLLLSKINNLDKSYNGLGNDQLSLSTQSESECLQNDKH